MTLNQKFKNKKKQVFIIQNTPKTPKFISKAPTSQTPTFFKKSTFIRISVFCSFVWPAFGGPTFLEYICIQIYIKMYSDKF